MALSFPQLFQACSPCVVTLSFWSSDVLFKRGTLDYEDLPKHSSLRNAYDNNTVETMARESMSRVHVVLYIFFLRREWDRSFGRRRSSSSSSSSRNVSSSEHRLRSRSRSRSRSPRRYRKAAAAAAPVDAFRFDEDEDEDEHEHEDRDVY